MRADRLLSLMLLLQARGKMTAAALAATLEVSERTIYRDIDALSIAGVPIYTQAGTNGGVFLDEGYRVSLNGLTTPEIQALFVAGASGPLADLGLGDAVEATLLKLLAALPPTHRHDAERMHQRVYFDPAGWFHVPERVDWLPALQEAVWTDSVIEAIYRRGDGTRGERRLQPYGLVAKASVWYLVAGEAADNLRLFRVSRFESVTLTPERFVRAADFDLVAFWQARSRQFEQRMVQPYPVTLKIAPHLYDFVTHWLTGRFTWLDDGDDRGWLTVRVTFGALEEARAYVMNMGADADVIDPPDLRRIIIDHARALLRHYAGPDAG